MTTPVIAGPANQSRVTLFPPPPRFCHHASADWPDGGRSHDSAGHIETRLIGGRGPIREENLVSLAGWGNPRERELLPEY